MTEQHIWNPPAARARGSELARFAAWLEARGEGPFPDYEALRAWSTTDLHGFWGAVAEYFDVLFHDAPETVLGAEDMPGAEWFPGATLNYAEQVFRHPVDGDGGRAALVQVDESGERAETTWNELRAQVAGFAAWLRAQGVRPGDRVAGYLSNTAEAVVAFLASAAIGAVWSACGQDYAPDGAADRLAQLEPVVLVAADGYRHNGTVHDRREAVGRLRAALPGVRAVVQVGTLGVWEDDDEGVPFAATVAGGDGAGLEVVPVPFDHPLWVLFSSGTTGHPKGIVHGHGGVVVEHLKALALHQDVGAEDRFLWFTTTSWMMWNFQLAGLLRGCTIVLYTGSPTWPGPDALWRVVGKEGVTVFGTSAPSLVAAQKADLDLGGELRPASLRTLGSTGAPLPASASIWLQERLPDVWITPVSGGTDIVSGFALGVPTLPVRHGEMQARALGVALESWTESGEHAIGEVGELVVTRPMPTMPLHFWADPDGERYRDAYFSIFPGVWRHGDWVSVSEEGGVVVHGRSDATMNRHGVRIGSADVYEVVDRLPEVKDCLVVGVEEEDGGYWMPLFVVPAGADVDPDALAATLRRAIREHASPRHVPDEVVFLERLPHTMTGKRLEVPVKRILQGAPAEKVTNPASVDDPDALFQFEAIAAERRTSKRDAG